MRLSNLYLGSVALLPVQTVGLDLGVLILKPSQFLFLAYLGLVLTTRRFSLPKAARAMLGLLFMVFASFLVSAAMSSDPARALILSVAFSWCVLFATATALFLHSQATGFQRLVRTLIWSATAYSLYGISQLALFFLGFEANVNFNPWDVTPRVPYFSAENVHAAFLLVALPLLFSQVFQTAGVRTSLVRLLLIAINLAGLVATGSRGAMLALILVLIPQTVFEITKRRSWGARVRVAALLGGAAFVVAQNWSSLFARFDTLIQGGDGTTSVRLLHYSEIFQSFADQPVFGLGLGGVLLISSHDVHNLFLQILFEGGLVAFTLFGVALTIAVTSFARRMLRGVSYVVGGSTGVPAAFGAVLLQAMVEPSLYFYHLYLVIFMLVFARAPGAEPGREMLRFNPTIKGGSGDANICA